LVVVVVLVAMDRATLVALAVALVARQAVLQHSQDLDQVVLVFVVVILAGPARGQAARAVVAPVAQDKIWWVQARKRAALVV